MQRTDDKTVGARQPKLLDLVAVLVSPADREIRAGDVGTVVEFLPPDAVEVEFLSSTAEPGMSVHRP